MCSFEVYEIHLPLNVQSMYFIVNCSRIFCQNITIKSSTRWHQLSDNETFSLY